MSKKVVVGMSGGVDSSVAAYILKEQGYEVIGVTMKIWQDETREELERNGGCCGISAVSDARKVADKLNIPYYVLDFRKDFKKYVIDYFINEYLEGKTPNPCIACNRFVKWESLLKKSLELGADYIATGHYAKVMWENETGRYVLKLSATAAKDQTYALYNLTQNQLAHTLMPIGSYTKPEIRNIAEKIGFDVAHKADSQEICFIPDNNYHLFIEKNSSVKQSTGEFVDLNGNKLGEHCGISHYTIGQRKGLGIAFGKPMYVHSINVEKNQVILCDNEQLFSKTLLASNLNFMSIENLSDERKVNAKIRYSHKSAPATIKMENALVKCTFDEPQRAITPGQAVVFYEGDTVLGGGVIQ